MYSHYIDELRQEIESVVAEHGWTKLAMGQMRKLDSFLKEAQRFTSYGVCEFWLVRCRSSYSSLFSVGIERKTLKEFTFSDGTTVPAGVNIGVPVQAIHHDEVSILQVPRSPSSVGTHRGISPMPTVSMGLGSQI